MYGDSAAPTRRATKVLAAVAGLVALTSCTSPALVAHIRPAPTASTSATASTPPQAPNTRDDCTPPALTTTPAAESPTAQRPDPSWARARPQDRKTLESLTVCPRPATVRESVPGYQRSLFGPKGWPDVDGNGCRQRPDVLWRDLDRTRPYTLTTRDRCHQIVTSGTWIDSYTGTAITANTPADVARLVQIDHRVSLQEAYASGARSWTAEQRRQFANWPANLAAIDASRNASKSADDAAAWRPAKAYQCTFAQNVIDTKSQWHLAIDPSEKQWLNRMLDTCIQ